MFEISARCKTIHDDSEYITASLHHFIYVLSVATEPLVKHIWWNDLASSSGIVIRTSLHHSLKSELMQNHSSVFILNDEDMAKQNWNYDLSQQNSFVCENNSLTVSIRVELPPPLHQRWLYTLQQLSVLSSLDDITSLLSICIQLFVVDLDQCS